MGTRDWGRATRRLAAVEDPSQGKPPAPALRDCQQPGCDQRVEQGRCDRHVREISQAIESYHLAHQDIAHDTARNRRRALRFFQEFVTGRGVTFVHEISLEALNVFRTARPISARTWCKELEIIKHFFRHCLDNEWILQDRAAKVKAPRNLHRRRGNHTSRTR